MIEIGMWLAAGLALFVGVCRAIGSQMKIKPRGRQPDSALNWAAIGLAAIAAFLFGRSQSG